MALPAFRVPQDEAISGSIEPFPFRLGHRPALDGLRGVSILLVLIAHIHLLEPRLHIFFPGGFLGVDVFFVISGFLITSLLLGENQETGRVRLGSFYIRRALRLLPAMGGVLVFTCLLAALFGSLSVVDLSPFRLLSILAYFMNWVRVFEPPQSWFLGHFWSLSVEEQFYSIWPVTLLFLLHWKRSHRFILLLVLAAIATSFSLKAILYLLGAEPQRIIFGSDTRAEPILIGCLLALVLHWNKLPSFLSERAGMHSGFGLIIGLGFVISVDQNFAPMYFGGFTLFALSVAAIILKTVLDPSSKVNSALCKWWLVWIGKRSYGIYLWHWPIYKLVKGISTNPWIFIPLAVIATFVIATLSYRYIERPFLELKNRRSPLLNVTSPTSQQVIQGPRRGRITPSPAPAAH